MSRNILFARGALEGAVFCLSRNTPLLCLPTRRRRRRPKTKRRVLGRAFSLFLSLFHHQGRNSLHPGQICAWSAAREEAWSLQAFSKLRPKRETRRRATAPFDRSTGLSLSLSLNLTSFSTLFSLFYFPQELSLLLQALGSRISWSRNHQNSELLRRWLQSGLEAALPSTEQQRRHRRLDPPRRLLQLP